MRKEMRTPKFYYGLPIYILGYKDEAFGYNITTSSSSYSLGDMIVMGLSKNGNAIKQIQKFGAFTLNIPTQKQALLMEQAGYLSKRDKLNLLDVSYTLAEMIDAPLIDGCPVAIECQVEQIQHFGNYVNVIARILKRWVDDTLLDDKGHFKSEDFHPMEYMGDGHRRVYRYLDKETIEPFGTFMKNARKEYE